MKITQKRLAALCDTLRALVPECRLMITESGISVLAVDTANVGIVSINLPKASFEEYAEETAEIGMDVTKWKDMLSIMKDPASTITINRDSTSGKIRISDGLYTYTHVPLDANTLRKKAKPPHISLASSVIVDAKEYNEVVKAMGVIGDKVRLQIDGEHLELKADGDTDSIRKEITSQPQDKKNGPAVASLFSIDYLKDVAKAMKDAGTITVHLGMDHPVRFDFDYEGMECSFLLAPRIPEEGEGGGK